MPESIFDSKKRRVTINFGQNPASVVKHYLNYTDYRKEVTVMREIGRYGFSPQILSVSKNELKEEYIEGKQLRLAPIDTGQLKELAAHLKLLHSHAVSPKLEKVLEKRKPYYDPLMIFKLIEKENALQAAEFPYYDLLRDLSLNFKPRRPLSLIHSDLNATNIIISDRNGGVFLIDWIESRLDYPLVDLANLVFQGNLDRRSKEIIAGAYGFMDNEMTDLNMLILLNAFFEHTSPEGKPRYAANIALKTGLEEGWMK